MRTTGRNGTPRAAHHCFTRSSRPEEEHVGSGEDEIIPPLRRGHEAMEEPCRWRGAIDADLEIERLVALLTTRAHAGRLMQCDHLVGAEARAPRHLICLRPPAGLGEVAIDGEFHPNVGIHRHARLRDVPDYAGRPIFLSRPANRGSPRTDA